MESKWYQIWNIRKWRAKWFSILTMGRTFLLLTLSSMVFFLLLGVGGIAENKFNSSPVSSMKGFASSLSSELFKDMLGMEIPHLSKGQTSSALSGEKMTTFVFQLLTSVNPGDPRSLLARELPGMDANDPVLLRSASGNENMEAPEDYHPDSAKVVANAKSQENEAVLPDPITPDPVTKPGIDKDPLDKDIPKETPVDSNSEVLIYHSHAREAFNPLVGTVSTNPTSASPSQNVMQVGSFIVNELKAKGVSAIHLQDDYPSYIKDYSYKFSYKYSRQAVKAALAQNTKLTYLLDIHRDSQRHKTTTTEINGVSYAQLYFIIGHENKNWRENEAFANSINKRLEKSYPGISRGIWGKTAEQGNGEYNQSLSPNSIVIEIGGVDSTEEELKRTASVLADTISDVYFADQKAKKASTVKSETISKSGD
ncbi:stage II sporulation protein P [Paenibacillus macquariensis]|uniref:Stage II sporulation protein P n=1 Tax=Paenibacillus macquariensis TaxID=948756 RepID=A0ABY1K197_9BACL|nr:stage II sporulation protein P [Paenibacillus macquariensis]MEC0091833.1 stage II sporulation protein P [Paenibacillus macquariensis]OAB32257.1 stage II sporulation protein P [Paenibacillus macquariensis subsp. macquariensis]SIR11159.1 stage II sporulation protein P [Paenibacillus macquariensis]